jgi:4-hydroxymandelate oxidase
VLVARPVLWALAAAGAPGVRQILAELTDDLAHMMALTGAASLDQLTPDLVVAT